MKGVNVMDEGFCPLGYSDVFKLPRFYCWAALGSVYRCVYAGAGAARVCAVALLSDRLITTLN